MRVRWLIGGVLVLLAVAAGCGGGDDNAPSDSALRDRLLPSSEVKDFKFRRSFVFTNAIDAGVQGLQLSENTQPSDVVHALEDHGFVKGAGEELQQGDFHGPILGIDAWKFDSDLGAQKARDLVHDEYRKQPATASAARRRPTSRSRASPTREARRPSRTRPGRRRSGRASRRTRSSSRSVRTSTSSPGAATPAWT
jgi:hypothetical protein